MRATPCPTSAAGCIEQPANGIAGIQQQEWIRGKATDIHGTLTAKLDRCGACSQSVGWWQDPALETGIALIKSDADVNFAAFEHCCLLCTECFAQLHGHVGKALSVLRKKPRQHALDRVRRRCDLHHSPVSAPKHLRPVMDSVEIGQHAAAIREKLLAFYG
jgi:hypothetical protein